MAAMPHHARVLCLPNDQDIVLKLKLTGVRQFVAQLLKETFHSTGGDSYVNRNVITATYTDVVLLATRKQFKLAFEILIEQDDDCAKLAAEMESAIRNLDSPASVPEVSSLPDQRVRQVFEAIGKRTLIMGILNVTPDSFSDGGKFADISNAVAHGIEMAAQGADIIDIGGESTRPGSEPATEQVEIDRILPVIRELAATVDVPISVDTYKASVARAALDAGASIVNDISGASFDPQMPALIAERRCPAILMHIKGTPRDMQANPEYDDLLGEIHGYLLDRIAALVQAGVDERLLMIDPGIGFGKTVEHNLELLRRLKEFKSIGRPIVVGTSRKAMIGKVLGGLPADERVEGTAATIAIAIANGADIVRVHDVMEMSRVSRITDAIVRGYNP